jgi:putative transposase
MPKYKDKQKGRNILIYTIQAISKPALREGRIVPSGLPIEVQTRHTTVDQVRIVPRHGFYVVEVIYEQAEIQAPVDPTLYAGIDIGLDNLATLTSNKVGFVPRIVNGRPLKSINQYYNKRRADLQSQLKDNKGTSNCMHRLTNKRTRRIDHYLHTASRRIIELLISEGIGTLVIGKNPLWKQEVEMGKRNNQQFVCIPHARFIDMLTYKAKLVGIHVIVTEESYTSKASFLDCDPIPVYGNLEGEPAFSGKRVSRGLYKAGSGRKFHADVNGSYNIIRKVAPDAFGKGVEDVVVVHPMRLAVGA